VVMGGGGRMQGSRLGGERNTEQSPNVNPWNGFLGSLNVYQIGLRVQIQKEVVSDLKRENQFSSKEIWESI